MILSQGQLLSSLRDQKYLIHYVVLEKALSNVSPDVSNEFKNFFENYSKYSLIIDGVEYEILRYVKAGNDGLITLKVKGKPFNGNTYSDSFLIRPISQTVEEFFGSLDELESLILDRESTPKYTAEFKLPKDSLDGSKKRPQQLKLLGHYLKMVGI